MLMQASNLELTATQKKLQLKNKEIFRTVLAIVFFNLTIAACKNTSQKTSSDNIIQKNKTEARSIYLLTLQRS